VTSYENDKCIESYLDNMVFSEQTNMQHLTQISATNIDETERAICILTRIQCDGTGIKHCSKLIKIWLPKSAVKQINENTFDVNAIIFIKSLQWDGL